LTLAGARVRTRGETVGPAVLWSPPDAGTNSAPPR